MDSEAKKRILIVEDEKSISEILEYTITRQGYEAVCAFDGATALELALEGNFDLILLDVMLPQMDGFEVCRRVREVLDTPIIMLTAREEEPDKIFGLEVGADDYITKPFSMRELLARVKANIRRRALTYAENPAGRVLRAGALALDPATFAVTKSGAAVELTQKEYDLLHSLMREPGKVFTREDLMTKVWNYDYFGDMRTVDVTVRRLREKIEDDPGKPAYILTRRGVGYYFAEG